MSAITRSGFDKFARAVSDALSRTFRRVEIDAEASNGKLLAYLAAHGEVQATEYENDRVTIRCRLPEKYLGRLNDPEITIRDIQPNDVQSQPELTVAEQK